MDGRSRIALAFALGLWLVAASGCVSHRGTQSLTQSAMSSIPRELDKATLPPYRVEPPDILLIEATRNIRPADTVLEAGDTLSVRLQNGLPLQILADPDLNPLEYQFELEQEIGMKIIGGDYLIGADGAVDFGPAYGKVVVAGLTVDAARDAIEEHMRSDSVGLLDPKVTVVLPDVSGKQPIAGEHLVRVDGTVSLGIYGDVHVAGKTLDEVREAVERHLADYMHRPQVSVDVLAYNSKVYYIIMDGGGFGEQAFRMPYTGNETVLDAITQVQGLSQVSSKKMWIARPAPAGVGHSQILDIHWRAIAAEGVTTTNYQLFPGDRIYIQADKLMATDIFLSKLIAPVERAFGIMLLGVGVGQRIDFYGDPNFSN